MCYISMDLFRQALQTNGKFFSNFKFGFKLLAENQNIQTNIGVNIDQSLIAMLYVNGLISTSYTN